MKHRMKNVEILTIGDELLRGDLVDTNSAWLAQRMHELGLTLTHVVSVGDEKKDIVSAIKTAIERSDIIITSGGLGPTDDDRTVAALAEAIDSDLALHQETLDRIDAIFKKGGLKATPNNQKQAWVPQNAAVLKNEKGTAPGLRVPFQSAQIFTLPGVPRELKWLFDTYIESWLIEHSQEHPAERRTLKVFGVGESRVDFMLSDLIDSTDIEGAQVSIHYRVAFPENHITLLVRDLDDQKKIRVADRLAENAAKRLENYLFATSLDEDFANSIVSALRKSKKQIAVAETCTGGLVSDILTRASGCSDVFDVGIVAYGNQVKNDLLGVDPDIFKRVGSVSNECTEAMAEGVRRLANADFGIAISGIAGPGGATPTKPVGTMHFAVATPDSVISTHRVFPFDRQRNKELSAYVSLWLVYRELIGAGNEFARGSEHDPLGGRYWPTSHDEEIGNR